MPSRCTAARSRTSSAPTRGGCCATRAAARAAQLCVVGFGTYRRGLERRVDARRGADLAAARAVAAAGRGLEGGPAGELRHLAAFLDRLDGDARAAWLRAAPAAAERVV